MAGKPKHSEKTCPSVTVSTTNPALLDPVWNPGGRDGKPATNRLGYGAAFFNSFLLYVFSLFGEFFSAILMGRARFI
jgi:hypothetical protein